MLGRLLQEFRLLNEDSYGAEDVPRFFRVVFDIGDTYDKARAEDIAKQLSKGRLKGLKGISSSAGITMQFLGVARNALLVMPAKRLIELNDVSRMMYRNPRYLFSKNMAAFRRIFSSGKRVEHSLQNLAEYMVSAAKQHRVTDLPKGFVYSAVYNGLSNIVWSMYREYPRKFNRPEDLAEWLKYYLPIYAKEEGSSYKDFTVFAQVTTKQWKALAIAAAQVTGEIYQDESEWVVKEDVLKIPRGSRLYLTKPEVKPEMLAKYREDPEDFFVGMSGWRGSIESLDFRESLVKRFGLSKRYKFKWITGPEFKRMQSAYFKGKKRKSLVSKAMGK